jgi:hypothetical protein
MHIGIRGGRWAVFTCADCHPDNWEEESGDPQFDEPYQVAIPVETISDGTGHFFDPSKPEVACPIDNCPRCGSRLSMVHQGFAELTEVR